MRPAQSSGGLLLVVGVGGGGGKAGQDRFRKDTRVGDKEALFGVWKRFAADRIATSRKLPNCGPEEEY